MTTTETRPRAISTPMPEHPSPGGAPTPHPTEVASSPKLRASGGAPASRQAITGTTPLGAAPAGADSRLTKPQTTPDSISSGGAQLAGRHMRTDAQNGVAASDQPTDRRTHSETHTQRAVGSEAGQDPAARERAKPTCVSLLDPALSLAAEVVDDLERVRMANANRLRILTATTPDDDGVMRGFGLDESHPDVAKLAAIVDMLGKVEKDAVKNLERHMRKHPLYGWSKSMRGVGDKQIARLLAAIGDPYIRPEIVKEDGTVIPSGPRTVSALWAYCGLHVLPASGRDSADSHGQGAAGRAQLPADRIRADAHRTIVGGLGGDPGRHWSATREEVAGVAPKRARGQKANWSTAAKTKAYLIAQSCIKQLIKPCHAAAYEGRWLPVHYDECRCSPYRVVYDTRRAHTATSRPDWTDGHSHNDALRVASKAILRDLWRAARDFHEST